MVFIDLLLLIVSIAVLVKSSDYFVENSKKISIKLGISEFIIGVTLVALGTSLPELMSSIFASTIGKPGVVVGNVIGSNFANIGLILGIGSIIMTIKVTKGMYYRDGVFMVLATFIFILFLKTGNQMNFIEGAILLLGFIGYTFYSIRSGKDKKRDRKLKNKHIGRDILIVFLAGVGIYYGAKYTVIQAVKIANTLNVPEFIVAFTVIAIGTSLPELSVTLSSAKKGLQKILLGNVIGSNIANLLLVGGISSMISPLSFTARNSLISVFVITVILLFFMRHNWRIGKAKGIVFLCLYLAFIIFATISNF